MDNNKGKFIKKFNKIPISILIGISIAGIYSFILLYAAAGGSLEPWAGKQITAFLFFMPIALLIAITDLKLIYSTSYIFYFIALILLFLVEFTGKSAMGATRWLDLGIITIQPSEIVKITLVLALARFFHDRSAYEASDIFLIIPLLLALIPIFLVIKQPDLGTGMIALMVVIIMFFLAGVSLHYFIIAGISVVSMAPIIWSMLHDYQKNRILTFLSPERDPLGNGYNIIQSKIAIGSGGLFGKGLLSGTQGRLRFLPEYQTDFIFAFLMEELGFIGGFILLILYSVIIIVSLLIAVNAKSIYAKLLCAGIISLFFCHAFINIAMVMGIVPVVGVPLPLISYGRTMMGSIIIGFGFIMNVAVHKQVDLK